MRVRVCALLFCLVACGGCGRTKSTEELIGDVKSGQEQDRLVAVRLLPQQKGDAAQIVPVLIASLHDSHGDIRRSAAIGLGNLGEQAKDAIPALQALRNDRDNRVREAAGIALARIDPARFSWPAKGSAVAKK